MLRKRPTWCSSHGASLTSYPKQVTEEMTTTTDMSGLSGAFRYRMSKVATWSETDRFHFSIGSLAEVCPIYGGK